jgi:hypothetical protein
MGEATLHIGDVFDVMATLPDASVDLGAYGGHGVASNHRLPAGLFRCIYCAQWTTTAALKAGTWADDMGATCPTPGAVHPDRDIVPDHLLPDEQMVLAVDA